MHKVNTLFVVTEMRLGGRESVTKNIAEELNRQSTTEIFSVWKREPFFKTNVPIVFGENISFDKKNQKSKESQLLNWVKNKLVIPAVKKILPYSIMQMQRIKSLSKYIKEHEVKNLILTDLTITFSPYLRREHPNLNIIGWVHMDSEHFFNKQYKDYKRELIRGFSQLNQIVTLTRNQAIEYSSIVNKKAIFIANPMPQVKGKISELTEKKIVLVSRIDIYHKGLDLLLKVLTGVSKEWSIDIAGKAQSEDEQKKFEKLIENFDLKDRVRLVGAKQGQDLDDFYASGSLFLMTSRFEGFPLTLGEAMSHGLPIISFKMDGSEEITGNGEFGILVAMGDTVSMSKTINSVINNKDLMLEYQNKSLKRVEEYSASKIINSWMNILQ